MECAYDGGGLGRGGAITLYLDGSPIGQGRVEATQPMTFSLDESMDVGCETGTMVAEDTTAQTSKFNGKIEWIQLDLGADDHDHLISPEERLRLAMTRQ
jgi:arylsulfatase